MLTLCLHTLNLRGGFLRVFKMANSLNLSKFTVASNQVIHLKVYDAQIGVFPTSLSLWSVFNLLSTALFYFTGMMKLLIRT